MSTFGGLNTAFSGLSAANQGLNVTGQNIANVGTDGYTRQRIETSSVAAPNRTGLFTTPPTPGNGVSVNTIARLGDVFAENRVLSTAADAGYTYVRADAMTDLELSLNEPGPNGVSKALQAFWSSWQDLSNSMEQSAPASVLLAEANTLTKLVNLGYTALEDQWADHRGRLDSMATDLNAAASQLGELNAQIRKTLNSGGTANELLDQRNLLATEIADLAGGTVSTRPDGMVDVYIGGNAIVQGDQVYKVNAAGARSLEGAATDPARLEWDDRAITAISLTGGQMAGTVSILAAADTSGTGGAIAEAAASYNAFATKLGNDVNTLHRQGATGGGTTGLDFFSFTAGLPAAKAISVLPTDVSGIAAANPGAGDYDGSHARKISLIGTGNGSPDMMWNDFVTSIGVASRAATQSGTLAENSHHGAVSQLSSRSEVSLDEETVNLVQYQQAYQANARVMSAIDEMLDTLINRTGIVGR